MSTFKNKNSLRTIEAQVVQKLRNDEAWPKSTGSYKKNSVYTAILNLCCRNRINFIITKFSNKTPQMQ